MHARMLNGSFQAVRVGGLNIGRCQGNWDRTPRVGPCAQRGQLLWQMRHQRFFPGFRTNLCLVFLHSTTRHATMLQRSMARAGGGRAACLAAPKSLLPRIANRSQSTAPATIVDRGFWRSLVPKPLRKENRQQLKGVKSKDWNPATFFIVIFLLIGSMSIQMIALRNSFQRYMRQSEVKIGLLREVVERIKNGEKVDVEQALGTGNPEMEADWEEGELDPVPHLE